MVSHLLVINYFPRTVHPWCILFLNKIGSMGFSCVASVCPRSYDPPSPFYSSHLGHQHHTLEQFFIPCKNSHEVHILLIYALFFLPLSRSKHYPLLSSPPQRERHRAFFRDQQEQVYRLHPGKVSLSLRPRSGQLNSCLEMTLFMMISGFILTHSSTACCNLTRCAV